MRTRSFAELLALCCRKFFWLSLFILSANQTALAHDPGLSTATVRLFPDKLEALITFAPADAAELADLDTDGDGKMSGDEFVAGRESLGELVAEKFDVRFDGKLFAATNIFCAQDENNNVEVHLSVPGQPFTNLTIRAKMIAGFRLDHRQYFLLQNPSGVIMAERLLSANSDSVVIQVDPPAEPEPTTTIAATNSPSSETPLAATPIPAEPTAEHASSFGQFLWLGIEHILKGYDHLLFLFGLLIVARDWKSSLTIITFFTVAHSITLGVATFDLLQIPGQFVEPAIAASIVYVGVENTLRDGKPQGRWLLTFAFGLIHGFGFASVLREMGVANRPGGVAMPLFSFNLGVELGQIAIAAVVLPIIWLLRKNEWFVRRAVPICSIAVALAGAYWFVDRVWG